LALFTLPKRTFSSKPVEPSKRIAECVQHSAVWRANDSRIAPEYLTFLARAYELKSIADYSVGPAARSITATGATRAIETAERFIDTIAPYCCRPA
jgi:hypothetical protein